jgi:hypothetical protein
MLALGRDLARTLGLERGTRLTRIEGGVAFQAPGVALVVLGDRIRLIHWTRPPGELSLLQDHLIRKLGNAYPFEDMRAIAAPAASRRAVKPQERQAERIVPDLTDPGQLRAMEEEAATPTPSVEDGLGPGL